MLDFCNKKSEKLENFSPESLRDVRIPAQHWIKHYLNAGKDYQKAPECWWSNDKKSVHTIRFTLSSLYGDVAPLCKKNIKRIADMFLKCGILENGQGFSVPFVNILSSENTEMYNCFMGTLRLQLISTGNIQKSRKSTVPCTVWNGKDKSQGEELR